MVTPPDFVSMIDRLAKDQRLVLDAWGTHRLTDHERRDLLELFEDRDQRRSTIITARLPVSGWHQMIGEPAIADAILDRIIHNAHRIDIRGDSMRRRSPKPGLTPADNPKIFTEDDWQQHEDQPQPKYPGSTETAVRDFRNAQPGCLLAQPEDCNVWKAPRYMTGEASWLDL